MEEPTKYCPTCQRDRPYSEFYKHKNRGDRLYWHCKECVLRTRRKRHAADPHQRRGWALRARYGIDLATWRKMLEDQGNACAMCGTTEPGGRGHWHTDHCHTTGKIRGLLCTRCNLGLAFIDDQEFYGRAVAYLRRYSLPAA